MLAALLWLVGCGVTPKVPAVEAQGAVRTRSVIIVSFDGAAPRFIQAANMPRFQETMRLGAGTWTARTITPSLTLPSHVSMLTGVPPEEHGVHWNSWAPDEPALSVPTIFRLAKAAGLHSAAFVGKEKFRHLDTPGTLDVFTVSGTTAMSIATDAAEYFEAQRPDLMFVHFPDADTYGHAFGWGSPEQTAALHRLDGALDVLWRATGTSSVAGSTVLILTADHGGHGKTHGDSGDEDMLIPWVVIGAGVRPSFPISQPVTTYDTAATVLWLLGLPVPQEWAGKPVLSAFEDPR